MFRFQSAEAGLVSANSFFERYMPVLTPGGVILGLLLSGIFRPLKPLVTWLFAFLTLVNGMSVSIRDFPHVIRHPKPIAAFMLTSYLLLPAIVTASSSLIFPSQPSITLGFVLLYAIPTAVVACVWSGIYSGSGALSLTLLIIGTLLAPVSTPLTVRILGGSGVTIDSVGMMLSLLWMVVIPSIAGILINTLTEGRCTEHVTVCLKPFTKIALLFVIIINTSQVADDLIAAASPEYLPPFLMAGVLTVAGFFISILIAKLFSLGKEETVSMTFASSMRNISAALVIAIDFFPPESVMPVISGVVLQQSATAIASHFIFGRKPEKNDRILPMEKERAINEQCQ